MSTWTHQQIIDAMDAVGETAINRFEHEQRDELDRLVAEKKLSFAVARSVLQSRCGDLGHLWAPLFHRSGRECRVCGAPEPKAEPQVEQAREATCSSAT